MSNLRTARLAIEAEIAHAKKGAVYYMQRVSSLEQALAQIVNAGEVTQASVETDAKEIGRAAGKAGKAKRGRRRRTETENGDEAGKLPSTAGDYWQNLIGEQPKSGADILAEAVRGLGFEPTRAQVGKLRNRMAFALNTLVKSGAIKDSGNGRERRYFRD